jgi:hypothetical protein
MRRCLTVSLAALLATLAVSSAFAGSLRFYADVRPNVNRVSIRLDPHVPADVGAGDFTIDFWMKSNARDNRSNGTNCAPGNSETWITGNIILDRAIWTHNRNGDYGLSMFSNGSTSARLAFGTFQYNGLGGGAWGTAICGTANVADGNWHHVAITRQASNGAIRMYVDGVLDAQGTGPLGNISYRDGQPSSVPGYISLNVDHYLGIGAEKYDADPVRYPSYNGLLDELRLSTTIRWTGPFTRPAEPHAVDAQTAALYHFDEGTGDVVNDAKGTSPGVRRYGGATNPGPQWVDDSPFGSAPPPPPPPAPEVWKLRTLSTGFLVRPVYTRNADGSRGAQLQLNGVPVNVYVGDPSNLPVCDSIDTAIDNSDGSVYMKISGVSGTCPYGHSLGAQITGYVNPCDRQ